MTPLKEKLRLGILPRTKECCFSQRISMNVLLQVVNVTEEMKPVIIPNFNVLILRKYSTNYIYIHTPLLQFELIILQKNMILMKFALKIDEV